MKLRNKITNGLKKLRRMVKPDVVVIELKAPPKRPVPDETVKEIKERLNKLKRAGYSARQCRKDLAVKFPQITLKEWKRIMPALFDRKPLIKPPKKDETK